jgi:2'-5' RNA ligase
MLLANPDERVSEKATTFKLDFIHIFGYRVAVITKPHITVAKFDCIEQAEDDLCECIQKVCNLQYSFTVALKDFKGFPPHTIYIHVNNPEPFRALAENLRRINKLLSTDKCRITFLVNIPHMTIARQMVKEVYRKAMSEYELLSFHDSFVLNKLVLLKRKPNSESWQHVKEFMLPTVRTLFN